MTPRLAAYASHIRVDGALVRPARAQSLKQLLLVGDPRVGMLFVPPFKALCRDYRCDLNVYLKPDWQTRLAELMREFSPDAIVVASVDSKKCADLLVWPKSTRVRKVVHVCPEATTPSGLAAASAQAWWHAQQPFRG